MFVGSILLVTDIQHIKIKYTTTSISLAATVAVLATCCWSWHLIFVCEFVAQVKITESIKFSVANKEENRKMKEWSVY